MPKVKLKAPPGTDEANSSFSPVPYKVDPATHIVEVDEEAVGPLLEKGGFVLAEPAPVIHGEPGKVRMVNLNDPAASCSFAGVSYSADEEGVVLVPAEAAAELMAHGFVSAADLAAKLTDSAEEAPSEPAPQPMPAPTPAPAPASAPAPAAAPEAPKAAEAPKKA